mmetsp:Transcript_14792/g.40933  ORF Transcript_14792/g.40933 Transcript_14792/m.40933 type:complete len:237 (-) Transcript_14792:243-953(-)
MRGEGVQRVVRAVNDMGVDNGHVGLPSLLVEIDGATEEVVAVIAQVKGVGLNAKVCSAGRVPSHIGTDVDEDVGGLAFGGLQDGVHGADAGGVMCAVHVDVMAWTGVVCGEVEVEFGGVWQIDGNSTEWDLHRIDGRRAIVRLEWARRCSSCDKVCCCAIRLLGTRLPFLLLASHMSERPEDGMLGLPCFIDLPHLVWLHHRWCNREESTHHSSEADPQQGKSQEVPQLQKSRFAW